jgi:N6-adenosine-specific RNA methylase IME4
MQLNIKTEFQELIPPLTKEEFEGLKADLIENGCRDKIILWKEYIIDGHHRYAICTKHDILFETMEIQGLETELDVKLWMIKNQIGKRNLTVIQRAELAIHLESIEKIRAKERQGTRTDLIESNIPPDLGECSKQGEALERAAKSVGLGYETVRKTKKIFEQAPLEIIEKVKQGDISIDRAYTNIRKAERLEANKVTEWPDGKYRVIYADPPWSYGDERSGMGGAIDHYNTMSLEDIKDLSVKELAEDNAVLFMWATAPLLEEAFEVVNAWGFKYKTNIIWNKVKPNLGNYTSVRHEHLIIATKGSCTPDNTERFNSVQTIERTGRHSEKPEEFRNIIETLYTYGNKIELFARKATEGWEVYGNEVESISEQTIN